MNISLFDYKLPQNLIAQKQIKPRDHSRLLLLDRSSKKLVHQHFYNLPDYLTKNDVLVVNETKVFPARLFGHKSTGGQVEIFLTEKVNSRTYQALLGGRRLKIGETIWLAQKLKAKIIKDLDGKTKVVEFNQSGARLAKTIVAIGQTPIPPYIKVKDSAKLRQDYQTIYASKIGSAAAPTAGLHFTKPLLAKLKKKGIKIFKVTLHVSLGTFAPVEVKDITKHKIHQEWAEIDKSTAQELNKLKKAGQNIVAVGTTTARTLEAFTKNKKLMAGQRWVDIYIYPGYKFKFVDDLITNFHLPKSSLLFMVSALAGRNFIMKAYQKAIKLKYRFFSFGDAMFITKNRL
jgi:S-adenosylmethionine:tRNA ribosyltransferase-isomerase